MDYTITLTDTEKKALDFVCVDIDEFLTNFAKERARRAKENK